MTGRRTGSSPVPKPSRSGPLTAFARSLKTVRSSDSFTLTLVVPPGPIAIAGA